LTRLLGRHATYTARPRPPSADAGSGGDGEEAAAAAVVVVVGPWRGAVAAGRGQRRSSTVAPDSCAKPMICNPPAVAPVPAPAPGPPGIVSLVWGGASSGEPVAIAIAAAAVLVGWVGWAPAAGGLVLALVVAAHSRR